MRNYKPKMVVAILTAAILFFPMFIFTRSAEPALVKQLEKTSGVSGKIVREDRITPVVGATVIVFEPNGNSGFAVTDENGVYKITNLTKGNYEMNILVSGSLCDSRLIKVPLNTNIADINFVISKPKAFVCGKITGNIYGNPVAQAKVIINKRITKKSPSRGKITAKVDRAGIYKVQNLPIGIYDMQVMAPGFGTSVLKNIAVKTNLSKIKINITIEKGESISGKIFDKNNKPVKGARIGVIYDNVILENKSVSKTNGNYTIKDLKKGNYKVCVKADGFARQFKPHVFVATGKPTSNIDFVMTKGICIYGKVKNRIGKKPIFAAFVFLTDTEDGQIVSSEFTDKKGRYFLKGILPGIYRIEVKTPDFQSASRTVSIRENEDHVVNFSLQIK